MATPLVRPSLPSVPSWWTRLLNQQVLVKKLGVFGWLDYRIQDLRLTRAAAGEEVEVHSRFAAHPLICRAHTSDHFAFAQVFVGLSYASVPSRQRPDLIVDCGANVGFSAAYFLSRYRGCHVIALEPDAANYRCLERNLTRYGDRVTCIRGALWSHPATLQMARNDYRDGDYWSRQVEERSDESGSPLRAFDVPALMRLAAADRISILKIDIEGAEAVVFSHPDLTWLDRVDTIMIELHDDTAFGDSTRAFHAAIADRGFDVWRDGELTVCSRLARR